MKNELICEMNMAYCINKEDILFILMSNNGVNVELPYSRVRFLFSPTNDQYFDLAKKMGVDTLFLALPVNPCSPFKIINENRLYLNDVYLGNVNGLFNDTCDTHYTRNKGHVINLNPVSKSQCHGCKFCHTIVQNANDTKEKIMDQCGLEKFLLDFMQQHQLTSLSSIVQIALVTGGFNSEVKLVEYIKMVAAVAKKFDFCGEILYFGAELTETGLKELGSIAEQLVYCYTVECFTRRETMLKSIKAKKTIDDIIEFFDKAHALGVRMTFSYVLGIDPIESIKDVFLRMSKHIQRFPIINVYQPHIGVDSSILVNEANNIGYYLEVRRIVEAVFAPTKLRPRTWENYRSLWYLTFADESLTGARLP